MTFSFSNLEIPEVKLVTANFFPDKRGYFFESFKESEFFENGINLRFVQDNFSHSVKGVLRGLHYQKNPKAQAKLVTALRGEIFDVAVDIRQNSPTFGKWVGEILSEANRKLLYIPEGFAHGFCVLSEEADVLYKVNNEYSPENERGIVWNDSELNIEWPIDNPILNEKDSKLPVLKNADKITAVYKIIEPYVIELCGKQPEILYNRINLEQFERGEKILELDKPLILTVSRLTPQKNHDYLIRAIKDLDVFLMIIGNGELKNELMELAKKLDLEERVIFKDSVPNSEIQNFYRSADIFALAYDPKVEGVPIPVLEAMASGLPIVIPEPIKGLSDGLDDSVIFAKHNPESFHKQLKKILEDESLREKLKQKSLEKSKEFNGNKTEKREYEIYLELINANSPTI